MAERCCSAISKEPDAPLRGVLSGLRQKSPICDAAIRIALQRKQLCLAELPVQSLKRLGTLVSCLRAASGLGNETFRLRRPYVTGVPIAELVEMFPGKSRSQIWKKAQRMGYRRPRRPPKLTGMPLVDSVRHRAFECRLSMTDLDAFVGRKYYFVSPRYLNWRALQKAMEILGGRPIVYWPDG